VLEKNKGWRRYQCGSHSDDLIERRDAGGTAVGSGVYIYRITAGEYRDQKKMVLLPR